ncbi:MAG: Fe3+/spermidine/putrescine ABC transporter ATP-binding protein, partial [Rubrivivax sp.]
MAGVTLSRIRKRYGDFTAGSSLDLDIREGELLALLGPSGCGKT